MKLRSKIYMKIKQMIQSSIADELSRVSVSSKSSGSISMSVIDALLKALANSHAIMNRTFTAANNPFVIVMS
jgi:hypothetical protein